MQAFLRLVISATFPAFMGGSARKIQVYSMKWDEKALKELVRTLEAGEIHVPIDGEYGWEKDDLMKAYERQMSARVSAAMYDLSKMLICLT